MVASGRKRWAQIYDAVLSGRPYKELAPGLGITENSLHNYAAKILRDLGCATRSELQGRVIESASANTSRWVGYSG